MEFNQCFRYFVDMTNAKFVEMADEMSLDRSNFSKWYNDKGLPNEDLWEFIRKKMVKYFSERMTPENIEEFMGLTTTIRGEYNSSGLEVVIDSVLNNGYRTSLNKLELEEEKYANTNMAFAIESVDEFVDVLISNINMTIGDKYKRRVDVFYSDDFMDIISHEFIDSLNIPFTSDQLYQFNYLATYETLSEDRAAVFDEITKFFRISEKLPFIDFRIYEEAGFDPINRFVVAGKLGGYANKIRIDDYYMAFAIKNKETIKTLEDKLRAEFESLSLIVKSTDDFTESYERMEKSKSKKKAKIFLPELTIYMFSFELREILFEKGIIDEENYMVWESVKRFFDHPSIANADLIVAEPTIIEFVDNGLVTTLSGPIMLEDEERELVKKEFEIFHKEKSARASVSIISKNIKNIDRLPKALIYSDSEFSCFIKPRYKDKTMRGEFYNTIEKKYLSEIMYEYLLALDELNEGKYIL